MKEFLMLLVICSATMSALALVYMAVTPLLARRYSVRGRYYSWLVIAIGLLIPFRPHFGNAIVKVDIPGNTAAPIIQIGNGTPITAPVGNVLPSVSPNISWWQITAAVWLTGIILVLAYHVIRHYRFLKLTARWSENVTDEKTLACMQNLKTQMGLSQNIGLQFCSCIGSPMLIGFTRPRILLPKGEFEKEELRLILKHELVHYKRKDLWYKCLVLIVSAIHWFNPIVYLMAKAINIQCELSCDEEVVRSTDADTRQYYIETIIGVVRYQSKLKTALSTNFYGGKKGMKERIFSIMDMNKKKAGLAVLCGVLILTSGTGFAFAANAETQDPPPIIQENIKEDIKEDIAVSCRFLPDPEVYSQYSAYGISISDDGQALLYNGQRVRLFADEHSDVQAFFLNDAGTLDLAVIRNAAGKITGIENISREKAQEYRSGFFADDISAAANTRETTDKNNAQDTTVKNKYEQYYAAYGIELSADGEVLRYNGQRVKLLADMLSDGSFETYWFDEKGTVNLSVVRNTAGQITAIQSISEEQAQKYHSVLEESEKNALRGLED